MKLGILDHVNILTSNLEEMTAWYRDVLGMTLGERPPFSFDGAWLYVDDMPYVHLIGIETKRQAIEPQLEHFAFKATGMAEFLALLESRTIDYRRSKVPSLDIIQINIHDPDGNRIHVDFDAHEAE
ncbi:MAG: VOC family protein [Hyphomicrobiales bacterium]